MLVDKDKQLKVDNWGSFFLHRLFLLYEKNEKCDGTLLFRNGSSIRVHKLVLETCTDYFSDQLWVNNTFTMPPGLSHEAVLPIINFMYTGYLNFNSEIHHSVFTAAKFLNVTILMKLLHAQENDESPAVVSSASDPVASISATTTTPSACSSSSSSSSATSSSSSPSSSSSSLPTVTTNAPAVIKPSTGKSVLRKVKRIPGIGKPILLKAQSSSSSSSTSSFSVVSASSAQRVPGKKLPFWKKRKTGVASTSLLAAADFYLGGSGVGETSRQQSSTVGPLTPTRFECLGQGDEPDEEAERAVGGGRAERPEDRLLLDFDLRMPSAECTPYEAIAYTLQPIAMATRNQDDDVTIKRPIEQVTKEISKLINKRLHIDDSPEKTGPVSNQDCSVMEVLEEASGGTSVGDEDDDDDDDRHFDPDQTCTELIEMDETMTSQSPRTAVNGSSSSEDKFDRLARATSLATPPKPILKPLTSECVSSSGGGSGSTKKVRFSLAAEGKENTESANSVTAVVPKLTSPAILTPAATRSAGKLKSVGGKEVVTSRVSITGDKGANVNATQIISELMKKNPDLMKNNKNIRVSIVTGGGRIKSEKPDTETTTTKVRYIVMKQPTAAGGGKEGKMSAGGSGQPLTGAENVTGPWMCEDCGVGGKPLDFETYYLYRRHLHDVHQERIDARICEYCGYKSSKRNLHLYHLYTKHNVAPPRNIRFPKCDKCKYIALSDSLLIKHNNNHTTSAEKISCKPCNVSFKSHAALQCHNQSCPHLASDLPPADKEYKCQYCKKTFNRSINLKAHMRIAHKNESRRMYDEEEEEDEQEQAAAADEQETQNVMTSANNLLQVIRLPVSDAGGGMEQRTLLLPAGMFLTAGGGIGGGVTGEVGGDDVSGVASSAAGEEHAMSTVASLNLVSGDQQTVILLDAGSSELVFDAAGNTTAMMLGSTASAAVSSQDGGTGTEFIVPEIIAADQVNHAHLYQTTPAANVDGGGGHETAIDQAYVEEQQQLHQMQTDGVDGDDDAHETMPASPKDGLSEVTSIIVVPTDEQLTHVAEVVVGQPTVDLLETVGTPDEMAGNSSPLLNSSDVVTTINRQDEDTCTNIVEVACKRDSIIIETSSVTASSAHSIAQTHAQKTNTDSVIVSAHAQNKATPLLQRIDLAKDWDEDQDDQEQEQTEQEQSDLLRPSRALIDIEETILPDI